MEQSLKIGIMGGTFNPIHNGHLLLARWVQEEFELDRMVIMPTGHSYMKRHSTLDGEHRLQMARLAVCGEEAFEVSDMEVRREGDTYTYETLLEYRKLYPQAELFFVVGADCLFTIDRWKHPEVIFSCCTLVAAARDHAPMQEMERRAEELMERFHGKVLLTSFPVIDLSSTQIRQRVSEGKSIRYMVPDKVREYIDDKRLYLSDN